VKRGEKDKIHHISRTAHQKWRAVRFNKPSTTQRDRFGGFRFYGNHRSGS
jgi:hypothetical protein